MYINYDLRFCVVLETSKGYIIGSLQMGKLPGLKNEYGKQPELFIPLNLKGRGTWAFSYYFFWYQSLA